eukprot:gene19670-23556_t
MSSEICFWPTVKDLEDLDLVLLTHVNGLLPFFSRYQYNRAEFRPRILNTLVQSNVEERLLDRKWEHSDGLARLANDHLGDADRYTDMVNNRDRVLQLRNGYKVFCLLPTLELANRAAAYSTNKEDRLTDINRCGIISILTTPDGRSRLLFTGDADGADIVSQLNAKCQRNAEGKHEFDFVDMPHHGWSINSPVAFLNAISTTHLVVSTNGSRYNHPDPDTIDALTTHLRDNPTTHLYFNYGVVYLRRSSSLSYG